MVPERVFIHSKKGYMVEHRCTRCGHLSVNRLALDDPLQPDRRETVMRLMQASAYKVPGSSR